MPGPASLGEALLTVGDAGLDRSTSDVKSIRFCMQGINYFVKNSSNPDTEKQVLHNLSIDFPPNAMVALMGTSGELGFKCCC